MMRRRTGPATVIAASVAAALAVAAAADAAQIVCDGVLGNSGAEGPTLVRFDESGARGMGVVGDAQGALWDRAGDGVLNRYAPDGRLLAQYRIPRGQGQNDLLTRVGDTLVMLVGTRLCTLPADAPPGSEARPTGREAACISFGSAGGRVAAATKEAVFLLDPRTGDATQVLAMRDVQHVEIGPDGDLFPVVNGQMHRVSDGREVADGWPRNVPGERPQFLGGAWFGHGWHGTIRRYDAAMEPSPGVVLGGASGSFIGHLDQNPELSNGRGLARVRGHLYAVSGLGGVMHLLEWVPERQQMQIVRRIGAVPSCGGIGLDRAGRVWWYAGCWLWTDPPDAPLRCGVNAPEPPGVGQAVMLESDAMVAAGWLWGQPAFYHGPLAGEVSAQRVEKGCGLRRGAVGATAYADSAGVVLLVVNAAGAAQAFRIESGGAYQGDLGDVAMKTLVPTREWTSLAMKDASTLLAAADGCVIEMVRDGKDWRETRRWPSWGSAGAEKFGGRIWIAADSGRLWVSDRERHRVVCLDLGSRKAVGTFGAADRKGTDLTSLALPERIAARGDRAVVFDGENQRLVKLRCREGGE